jgi:hypothetical protein
VVQLGHAH